MSSFLKNRGFYQTGSNGQPRCHYKLPFRIQNWTLELGDSDIDLIFIIADEKSKSGYILYRSDVKDRWTDGVYVNKSEAKEKFNAVIEYLKTAPVTNNSNIYGSSCHEKYEEMLNGTFGIPASSVV